MKSIVEIINEALSPERLKTIIERKKNFKALMKYLQWDEDIALDNIMIGDDNIDEDQFKELMKCKENTIECEVLNNDPNYSHFVTIDCKYEIYLTFSDEDF